MQERRDAYQRVTEDILAALDRGIVPWSQPWRNLGEGHRNLTSDHAYRGVNPLLLDVRAMMNGYEDPFWLTFKQAKEAGGCVRKGEKAQTVVFWKRQRVEDRETGEERVIPILRFFHVFNVAQVDGVEAPEREPLPPFDPIERAEQVIAAMPNRPEIAHGGDSAFYALSTDHVRLPLPGAFETRDAYYSTAFHELTHSTAHESRVGRKLGRKGTADYAREELVAEIGATMLARTCGVDPCIEQSAAYIDHWRRAVSEDRKLVVLAAARAQRSSDYILGVKFEEER